MVRYSSRRRSSRRRYRFQDWFLTIVFFAVIAGSVVLLDGYDPQTLDGSAKVVDGDSLILEGERLRLSGIDAPELAQSCTRNGQAWSCGRASRNALRNKLRGQSVTCKSGGFDRYDRWLAVCRAGGEELNAWMVEQGWAVDYGGYAREEASARRKNVGIWEGEFENPQEWRQANRSDASALPHGVQGWRNILSGW